jgi:hypothetical protein
MRLTQLSGYQSPLSIPSPVVLENDPQEPAAPVTELNAEIATRILDDKAGASGKIKEGLEYLGIAPVLLSGAGFALGNGDFTMIAGLHVRSIGTRQGIFGRQNIDAPYAGSSVNADGTITFENGFYAQIIVPCPVGEFFILWISREGEEITLRINGKAMGAFSGVINMVDIKYMIGGVQTGSELPFGGFITRAQIWDRAITQSEYSELVDRGLNPLPSQMGNVMFLQGSSSKSAGFMVADESGKQRNFELPASGVSVIGPDKSGQIHYTRTSDGYVIGDRVVIPTGYGIESVLASGNGTASLGEASGTPANVCASVTLSATPKPLPVLISTTSNGKLYIDLGTATTATFTINLRRL